jgi:predicted RNA binding protein YcfA (HicA-like mRNA interferase family)
MKSAKMLHKAGWIVKHITGSHVQMQHPIKSGIVAIPSRKGDIAPGTVASIKRQAGLNK